MNQLLRRTAATKVAAAAGLALAALALSSCTAQADGASEPVQIISQAKGLPKSVRAEQFSAAASNARPVAYWTDAERASVTLVTYGSSSCPAVPTAVTVLSATQVLLPLERYDGACTADLSPHTTVFTMPKAVTRTKPVSITLNANDDSQFDTELRLEPDPTLATLAQ